MTNELQTQAATSTLPTLATVKTLPSCFPLLELTPAAINGHIFKSQDRLDSKGRKIAGNGLAATGAIIRRGRKILIDVDKYAGWLSSGVAGDGK
ncbi:MAG: hypothetical protein K8R50_10350 [Betaproteobacteria bacterium]|nr:hypothetical protein [Betaproteobacteria bacterium]